jgi:hypothetical protein
MPAPARAQVEDVEPEFLRPYGLENFSQHYRDALRTFLQAEELYFAGDPLGARQLLEALWAEHPEGGADWGSLPRRPFDIFLGTPPCYYALRMLTDITAWRLRESLSAGLAEPGGRDTGLRVTAPQRTARLTVVVVGQSSGIQPRTVQELQQGTGAFVLHTLDERVPENDYHAVHESLRLFREYTLAMTRGKLGVEVRILELPATRVSVSAHVLPGGGYIASMDSLAEVWADVTDAVRERTDWWWVLYPSHVPEQHPDFANAEFITGGMATGPASASPAFLIDDRWIVRKPPHLGRGAYSDVERRVYLPQWLQHEFFHHLFRTYPEFGLEVTPHQWFDRGTWPADFVGIYESDYFHESLVKRLRNADPPLHVGLRYATVGAPYDELTINRVIGTYRREPVENPWHIGNIELAFPSGDLRWANTAGVSWGLEPDLQNGLLRTGPDCPYYDPPNGTEFRIVFERDAMGDFTSRIAGFVFGGELYRRD